MTQLVKNSRVPSRDPRYSFEEHGDGSWWIANNDPEVSQPFLSGGYSTLRGARCALGQFLRKEGPAGDFVLWLHRRRFHDDPVGDIARDVAADKSAPRGGGFERLLRHVIETGASVSALRALWSAYYEYCREELGLEIE